MKKLKIDNTISYVIIFCLYIVVVYFILFILTAHGRVVSRSMEPTLMTGDICFYNRMAYMFGEPKRGDIVLFERVGEKDYLAKRIIGLPGDHVSFQDGCVFVNDTLLEEEYIGADVNTYCWLSFDVPKNSYFVLGDNREHSLDSRFWDDPYVSKENIVGSYIGTIWHTHIQ